MKLGHIFRELRRRKVLRVAVVYAVVAWAIIQVADTIFPHLDLPPWLVTAVVVFALLGFPIALVLAWAFEVTPEGVKRTPERTIEDNESAEAPVRATRPADGSVRAASAKREVDESAVSARAIAVLPFETLGQEKATAFTDAIHGEC